ncbi:MAG: TIGR00266 family protein [Flavobacteriales bacterium]|nr:TIGR00266 family protein [Flavobacteriales bacterium]
MKAHEIDYTIAGDDMQIVSIHLDPNETVVAEAGAMNWMQDGISFTTRTGDGSKPDQGFFGKILDVGKRVITGESIFMTHFTNTDTGQREVSFAAPYPGKIIPLEMSELGGEILCQKDAFLCAAHGTEISVAFNKRLGSGFFGGEGFILQRLRGDGKAFLHAGGTVVKKELNNEIIRIDTGCIVAFSPNLDYSIERAGNLRSMIFGGEGLFLATLKGTGTIYLQSLPFSRLADRILMRAPKAGGKAKGEGSVLGGLGRMIDGDNF